METAERDLRERWIKSMEEYYRDTYPAQMKAKVLEILPKNRDRLKALYEIIIRDQKAWMRAIRVPGTDAVEAALTEMYEAYPEFSASAIEPPDRTQISDEAGFDPAPIFEQIREAFQKRKGQVS